MAYIIQIQKKLLSVSPVFCSENLLWDILTCDYCKILRKLCREDFVKNGCVITKVWHTWCNTPGISHSLTNRQKKMSKKSIKLHNASLT